MHHGRRPAKGQHRLIQVGQGQVHGKQAKFLVVQLRQRHAPMGQPPPQPLAQHRHRHWRRQSQGGFLHKEQSIAEIHRVEEGGGFQPLRLGEVIAAIVHQYKLTWLHRRCAEAPHQAVGGLAGHGAFIGPGHEHGLMARGIHHQSGSQLQVFWTAYPAAGVEGMGSHWQAGAVDKTQPGCRAAPEDHAGLLALLEPMSLEFVFIKQAIVTAER